MTTTITAKKTAAKIAAAAAAAPDRFTLAEALGGLREYFQGSAAYPRKGMARTRAQFDCSAATDLVYAAEMYLGSLAKDQAIVEVWAAFEVAYQFADETGATWATMGNLLNQMIVRQLFDAGSPGGCSDPIRSGIEGYKTAGRATALREIRDLIAYAEDKIAHSIPEPTADAIA